MTGLAQWSLDKGLLAHVNKRTYQEYEKLITPLVKVTKRYGSLEALAQQPHLWRDIKNHAGISDQVPIGPGPRPHRGFKKSASDDQSEFYSTPRQRHARPFLPPEFNEHRFRPEMSRRELNPKERSINDSDKRPKLPSMDDGPVNLKIKGRLPGIIPLSIYNQKMELIVGHPPKKEHRLNIPIIVSGEIKGYIVYANRERLIDDYDLDISKEISQYLWWITSLMIILSAALAMPFSRFLIKPIRPIVETLHQLAKGDLKAKVEVHGKDEIAQVANDVNNLALTLSENDDSRKKWLANISHELRTPIAVMRGELEAMIDGVREIDMAHIRSAHQDTLHLQRLVEDLYQLTSSDIGALSYHKENLDIVELIVDEIEHLEPLIQNSGHILEFRNHLISNQEIWMLADAQRITQIIKNLIQNSVKYTQAPGRIKISLNHHQGQILLNIEDSAPTVKNDELEKIFDHLYRAETSRNRKTGGSGLGLAICKKIIEGHSGSITAKHSDLGGIKMLIHLPTQNN